MKKFTAVLVVLITTIVLCAFFFSYNQKEPESAVQSTTQNATAGAETNIITATLDISKIYDDYSEIARDPEVKLIISGTVVKTDTIYCEECIYTVSTVTIDRILKGDAQTGKVIYVMEHGGLANSEQTRAFLGGEEKIGKEKRVSPSTVIFDDYQFAKARDEVVFFLKDCANAIYEKTANVEHLFVPAGAIQGKLTKDNELYISNTPDMVIEENPNISQSKKGALKQAYSLEEIEAIVKDAN